MKKLAFIIAFVLIGITGASIAATTNVETNEINGAEVTTVKSTLMSETEALHCKVTTPSGTTISCWFCDCKALYDSVMQ